MNPPPPSDFNPPPPPPQLPPQETPGSSPTPSRTRRLLTTLKTKTAQVLEALRQDYHRVVQKERNPGSLEKFLYQQELSGQPPENEPLPAVPPPTSPPAPHPAAPKPSFVGRLKRFLAFLANLLRWGGSLLWRCVERLRRCLDELSSCDAPTLASFPEPPPSASLPALPFVANWKQKGLPSRHIMLKGRGAQIEEILAALVVKFHAEKTPGTVAGLAAELPNTVGTDRPLRLVHIHQKGHLSASDVILRAEGGDLFLKREEHSRTALAPFRWIWNGAILAIGTLALLWIYLTTTGAYKSWAEDYGKKHALLLWPQEDKSTFLTRSITEGCHETDWMAVREEFVENPETVKKLSKVLSAGMEKVLDEYVANQGKVLPQMEDNIFFSQKAGTEMMIRKLKAFAHDLGEYAPDAITQLAFKQRNNDEYAYFYLRGGNRISKFITEKSFSSVEDQTEAPMFSSQSLEPVWELAGFGDYFSVDPDFGEDIRDIIEDHSTHHGSWSYLKLFYKDPRIGISNLIIPTLVIAALIAALLWKLPARWKALPIKKLGWPTPEEFNARVERKFGWMERILNETLEKDFAIQPADIIPLRQ